MILITKNTVLAKMAALAMGSAAVISVANQADARPRHHHHRQAVVAATGGDMISNNDGRMTYAGAEAGTRASRRGRAAMASASSEEFAGASFGSSGLVSTARGYLGTNPTGRSSLWCGAFMDLILKKTGHNGGGNLASSYSHYGTRVSGPQVGAIAVMGRRGGGHVGVVSGIDANGNPIIISGNHNRTVAESVYPRGRITAYVLPN
jgi:uncharacterized protein (TIGR02594 family)